MLPLFMCILLYTGRLSNKMPYQLSLVADCSMRAMLKVVMRLPGERPLPSNTLRLWLSIPSFAAQKSFSACMALAVLTGLPTLLHTASNSCSANKLMLIWFCQYKILLIAGEVMVSNVAVG